MGCASLCNTRGRVRRIAYSARTTSPTLVGAVRTSCQVPAWIPARRRGSRGAQQNGGKRGADWTTIAAASNRRAAVLTAESMTCFSSQVLCSELECEWRLAARAGEALARAGYTFIPTRRLAIASAYSAFARVSHVTGRGLMWP